MPILVLRNTNSEDKFLVFFFCQTTKTKKLCIPVFSNMACLHTYFGLHKLSSHILQHKKTHSSSTVFTFRTFFFCSNYKFVNMLIFIHVSIKLFYRVLPNDFKVINMALSYVFIKRTRVICYWLGHMRPICASDFKKKKLLASSRFRVFKYLRVLVINSISFL